CQWRQEGHGRAGGAIAMNLRSETAAAFEAFVRRLRAHLEAGERSHADRSRQRPPDDLLGEVEDELLDVCGWTVILFVRMRRLRAALPDLATAPAADHCMPSSFVGGSVTAAVDQGLSDQELPTASRARAKRRENPLPTATRGQRPSKAHRRT